MALFDSYSEQLRKLDDAGRKRQLVLPRGTDFSSNDYLGLASSQFLRDVARSALDTGIAHGAGGSRLLGGNHREHEMLESFAAEHYHAESALFLGSGYAANTALFSTLPQQGDIVLYDTLVHASVHDGMKLGRAEFRSFLHNDCDDLSQQIARYRQVGGKGAIWIATESLFSMDGDRAPLGDLLDIAKSNDAMLVIDEAHAVGVFGEMGTGLSGCMAGAENVITLRTCGKALGVEGGLITMPKLLKQFFVNRARAFIFSTAPSPLSAHMVHQAIRHIADTPQLQTQLLGNISHAESLFGDLCPAARKGSQIFPVILGEDKTTIRIAARLQADGFDVRAIRPPTVPKGSARLRISMTLNASRDDISNLSAAMTDALHMAGAPHMIGTA